LQPFAAVNARVSAGANAKQRPPEPALW
jgi:hypothetical protein